MYYHLSTIHVFIELAAGRRQFWESLETLGRRGKRSWRYLCLYRFSGRETAILGEFGNVGQERKEELAVFGRLGGGK